MSSDPPRDPLHHVISRAIPESARARFETIVPAVTRLLGAYGLIDDAPGDLSVHEQARDLMTTDAKIMFVRSGLTVDQRIVEATRASIRALAEEYRIAADTIAARARLRDPDDPDLPADQRLTTRYARLHDDLSEALSSSPAHLAA